MRNKMSAVYQVTGVLRDRVFIVDLNGPRSVTNDAEAVVTCMNRRYKGMRVIYRDTTGRWDELKHSNGVFTDFARYSGITVSPENPVATGKVDDKQLDGKTVTRQILLV